MEQKSERVQNLITQIMSNLLQIGNSYEIQTPSFYMNTFILNISNNNLPVNVLSFQSGTLKLPPFCDLIVKSNLNCSNFNFLALKVILFTKESMIRIILIFFTLKAHINVNGCEWPQWK